MVRMSIPSVPVRAPGPPSALTLLPVAAAGAHLAAFLERAGGKALTITGAGVSVDSGIRAYRGAEGRYINPNYSPIFYSELVEASPRGELFRVVLTADWGRSFLGYPPVRDARPNPTHIYVAALQALGLAPGLITQNVDNLHRKALGLVRRAFAEHGVEVGRPAKAKPTTAFASSAGAGAGAGVSASTAAVTKGKGKAGAPAPDAARLAPSATASGPTPLVELHGTLARVHCLSRGHDASRDSWQDLLASQNPIWDAEARRSAETGESPRTNPDGDVALPGADYSKFVVPPCGACESEGIADSIVKPNVIFFGETLPPQTRDDSFSLVESASAVLVLGTTLATYSAFRLIKAAHEAGKPVLMVSLGPSRADDLAGVDKMERPAGPVLRAFLDEYIRTHTGPQIDAVRSILDAGITVNLPKDDVVSAGAPHSSASLPKHELRD